METTIVRIAVHTAHEADIFIKCGACEKTYPAVAWFGHIDTDGQLADVDTGSSFDFCDFCETPTGLR